MFGIPFWLLKIGGVVAIIAAVWGHGYIKGSNTMRAACEEKARQAIAAADKQDNTARERIIVQEKVVDEELKKLNDAQAQRIKELEANVQTVSPSCVYPMPAPKYKPPAGGVRGQPARPRTSN